MQQRINKFDFFRTVAIFAVLIGHSVLVLPDSVFKTTMDDWFHFAFRPAVPIFLFLSGALYRTGQDGNYLKNKLSRVICPYLFFSIVALIYTYKSALLNYRVVLKSLVKILSAETISIYYYVFIIVSVYLAAFIIDKVFPFKRHITSILIVSVVINLLHAAYMTDIFSFVGINKNWMFFYYYRALPIWFAYFALGIYYRQKNVESFVVAHKCIVRLGWLFTFLLFNLMFFEKIGNIDGLNSVLCTVFSLGTIALLLTFNIKSRFFEFISRISYSVYLSHVFFILILLDVGKAFSIHYPYWFMFISPIIYFAGTLGVFYIAKLIFKDKSFKLIGA